METCSGLHFLQGWTLDLAACSPASAVAAFVFVACKYCCSRCEASIQAATKAYIQHTRSACNRQQPHQDYNDDDGLTKHALWNKNFFTNVTLKCILINWFHWTCFTQFLVNRTSPRTKHCDDQGVVFLGVCNNCRISVKVRKLYFLSFTP